MKTSRIALITALVVASACTPGSPGDDPEIGGGVATTGRSPTAETQPTGAEPSPEGEIASESMTLLGNLPGTDGSFAFWGDLAVANVWADHPSPSLDDGFIVVDISDPARPREVSRFRCIASHNDISIWEDLVFLSQDTASAGEDCEARATSDQAEDFFAGIRVVSIADPEHPVLVAAVPTGVQEADVLRIVRGSHTHTPIPELDHVDEDGNPAPRVLIYSADRWSEQPEPHATIVEVPLDDPSAARAIGTIDNRTNLPCHDISVFLPRNLMACAAYEAGVVLFDISEPERPKRLASFINPHIASNHHSTTFSNDGRTLVLSDEIFSDEHWCGTQKQIGALWFYDVSDSTDPIEQGWFQLPRPNADHFCYPHESNVVPLPSERDIVVTGWFGGGVNLVDFTDPTRPVELAWWVSSLPDGEHSFAYAGYWYDGHVYAANTALDYDDRRSYRGFDVFEVDLPVLSKAISLPHMNAQTQEALPR